MTTFEVFLSYEEWERLPETVQRRIRQEKAAIVRVRFGVLLRFYQ